MRWGRQPRYAIFGGPKAALERPRARTRQGQKVELERYQKLQRDGRTRRAVAERIAAGPSTRQYHRAVKTLLEGYGIRRTSVSRHPVRATAQQLRRLCERSPKDLALAAVLIDGIEFAGRAMIVAPGLDENGIERAAGLKGSRSDWEMGQFRFGNPRRWRYWRT